MSPIRHAAIGVFIAAVLAIGASAGSDRQNAGSTTDVASILPSSVAAMSEHEVELFIGVVRACRNSILDIALDAYGEAAAHLKQF